MIRVLQFAIDYEGEYSYNVVFETGFEKKKLQTNEAPCNELLEARNDMVRFALLYFSIADITATFKRITFSYPSGDSGKDHKEKFVLELEITAKENPYEKHQLKTEKIDIVEIDFNSSPSLTADRGFFIEAVLAFRETVEAYAKGEKAQRVLPFEVTGEKKGESAGQDKAPGGNELALEERG